MSKPEAIRVTGLREFRSQLKALDRSLPKVLRIALNDVANVIVDEAHPDIPVRTGRARRSVKAQSTQKIGRVVGGGNSAPYYPWLDFGGRVGPANSVHRPVLADGRYIYPAYKRRRDDVPRLAEQALRQVAQAAGLEVK